MRRVYFGYYVVAALFIAEIAVTGISFYSFSLFIRAWQEDPALGWSLTAINTAFSVGLPLAMVSPFMGRLIDRRGPKLLMLLGVPLIALAFVFSSFMTRVWHLWALQAMLVLGQSAAFLGTGKLVGMWFHRDRGRMMGIALAGNNMGGIVMAPLTARLLAEIGWRSTFLAYGVGLFLVNTLVILFLIRDKPAEIARAARAAGRVEEAQFAEQMAASGGAAGAARAAGELTRWQDGIRTPTFWLIAVAFIASSVSIFGVLSQLANHLKNVGIDVATAGMAISILGFFGLLGKLVFGYASEKVPVRYTFAATAVLQIVGIAILLLVGSPTDRWLLYPFVALYGLGFGAAGALMPLVMTESFGLAAYGAIFGVMQVFLRVFNAGVPPLIGRSVDATGSYLTTFVATMVLLGAGTAAILFTRGAPRRATQASQPLATESPRLL